MFSKLLLSISFSQLLHSNKHKTLSTVSFSFASDTNYHAFFLMSTEGGGLRTHAPTLSFTHMQAQICTHTYTHALLQTHSHICKIAAAPSNYRRWEPLTSCNIASPSYCCRLCFHPEDQTIPTSTGMPSSYN